MFTNLKKLLESKDGKPTTITFFIANNDCTRLAMKYIENGAHETVSLAITAEDRDGSIHVYTSDSLDDVRAIGLLESAIRMIGDGK